MKYILILIGWIILTVPLIIERSLKVIASVLIFLWDFKIVKERYSFWSHIHLIAPDFNSPHYNIIFVLIKFKSYKDFYYLND